MLRDSADDVREKAIEAWMGRPEMISRLFDEYARAGSRIAAEDLYDWQLDRMIPANPAKAGIVAWATRTLDSADAREAHKVLAIVLLARTGAAPQEKLTAFTTSKNPWLRRAAYRALGLGDGRLELCLIRQSGPLEAAWQFPRLLRGTHIHHPKVRCFPGTELAVETVPPAPVAVDGELVGFTPATFTVRPGSLRVFARRSLG